MHQGREMRITTRWGQEWEDEMEVSPREDDPVAGA